ncbi:hypothetical protein J6590_017747 [Homalodisca vitripennis]|nr:hypothetical protein J6590_017747 [Homalodisca vitripennis]
MCMYKNVYVYSYSGRNLTWNSTCTEETAQSDARCPQLPDAQSPDDSIDARGQGADPARNLPSPPPITRAPGPLDTHKNADRLPDRLNPTIKSDLALAFT